MDCSSSRHPEFFYKPNSSHEPEIVYLKSLEIEEKINNIRWCQTANNAMFLLSTNDKTIKFWKVQEKKIIKIFNFGLIPLGSTLPVNLPIINDFFYSADTDNSTKTYAVMVLILSLNDVRKWRDHELELVTVVADQTNQYGRVFLGTRLPLDLLSL